MRKTGIAGAEVQALCTERSMTLFTGENLSDVSRAVKEAAQRAEDEVKSGYYRFQRRCGNCARLFFKRTAGIGFTEVDVIFAAGVREEGIGIAVMNRMRNAADGNIVHVE